MSCLAQRSALYRALRLSTLRLRAGLTGSDTVPQLPGDDPLPLLAKAARTKHGRGSQVPPPPAAIKNEALPAPELVPDTALPPSPMDAMEKDERSATLAARSVIQQQTDLMALAGARPAEIPSEAAAAAGHSPPTRPAALTGAEPPGAPLPLGQLTRRSPRGGNSAANAAAEEVWVLGGCGHLQQVNSPSLPSKATSLGP